MPVTVVGVMGQEFFGERVRKAPDYWLPMQLQPRIELSAPIFDDVRSYGLRLLGRLAPGKTLAQATSEATAVLRRTLTAQNGNSLSEETTRLIAQSFVTLVPGDGESPRSGGGVDGETGGRETARFVPGLARRVLPTG